MTGSDIVAALAFGAHGTFVGRAWLRRGRESPGHSREGDPHDHAIGRWHECLGPHPGFGRPAQPLSTPERAGGQSPTS